jgi:uncharacterized protein YggE
MKRILFIGLLAISFTTFAQDKIVKKISVSGSASMEVVPDEIFVQINLKEYKNGSKKVDLNKLESELVAAVKALKIPEENLMVQNISGYNWNWKKRKSEDFLATKSFKLKVSDLKKINELVNKLDSEGINSMNVVSYEHSKIEEFRKQLKIEAIKAAKEKAEYLLAAVDEELGGVIEVNENSSVPIPNTWRPGNASNRMMEMSFNDQSYESNLEFQKIKLSSEIYVVFVIK